MKTFVATALIIYAIVIASPEMLPLILAIWAGSLIIAAGYRPSVWSREWQEAMKSSKKNREKASKEDIR